MSALLKPQSWAVPLRVLVVLLAAQPAVAGLVSSAAVRWPVVAAIAAAIEALAAAVPTTSVTSEPAPPPGKGAP